MLKKVRSPFLKKRFSRKITILFISPKLLLFPDHVSSWSSYLHNSYHTIWYSWVTTSPLLFLLLKLFPKLAHRTEQFVPAVHIRGLGYSNSFTLCRGSTLFPHPSGNSSCQPRPAIQGVCEVEPPAIAFPLLMLV